MDNETSPWYLINSGDTSLLLYFFFQMRAMVHLSERAWINCELSQFGGETPPLRESYYIVDCCAFSCTFLWSILWCPRREADHGQKLCGSPFSFPNHLQAPNLAGKDAGIEAVGRESSTEEEGLERGGENMCMGLLVIRRFKLWKKLINNETSDWMMQIMKTGFVSSCN